MNTGPFSQCFIVLPTSNSVVSAINRVSTLHLSQVVHVNVVQTQPKVTHKHSWPGHSGVTLSRCYWVTGTHWLECTCSLHRCDRWVRSPDAGILSRGNRGLLSKSSCAHFHVTLLHQLIAVMHCWATSAEPCKTSFQEELPLLMRCALCYYTGSQVIPLRRAKYCHSSITLWQTCDEVLRAEFP